MVKRIGFGLSVLCWGLVQSCFAVAQVPQLCPTLTGTWQGVYHDPSGLFISQNFPIELALSYQNGHVYGYTLPSNDQLGAHYGTGKAELFAANCSNNQLSQIIVLSSPKACGSPAQGVVNLSSTEYLTLPISWENAMIGTTFIAQLRRVQDSPFNWNTRLLYAAKKMDQTQWHTCH